VPDAGQRGVGSAVVGDTLGSAVVGLDVVGDGVGSAVGDAVFAHLAVQ